MRYGHAGAGVPLRRIAAGAVAVLLTVTGVGRRGKSGGQAAGGESAVWTPKELLFIYQGFTTRYSCDGPEGCEATPVGVTRTGGFGRARRPHPRLQHR